MVSGNIILPHYRREALVKIENQNDDLVAAVDRHVRTVYEIDKARTPERTFAARYWYGIQGNVIKIAEKFKYDGDRESLEALVNERTRAYAKELEKSDEIDERARKAVSLFLMLPKETIMRDY